MIRKHGWRKRDEEDGKRCASAISTQLREALGVVREGVVGHQQRVLGRIVGVRDAYHLFKRAVGVAKANQPSDPICPDAYLLRDLTLEVQDMFGKYGLRPKIKAYTGLGCCLAESFGCDFFLEFVEEGDLSLCVYFSIGQKDYLYGAVQGTIAAVPDPERDEIAYLKLVERVAGEALGIWLRCRKKVAATRAKKSLVYHDPEFFKR